MYVNDFKTSEKVRLNQVLHTLKSVHGVDIRIDLGSSTAERDLMECHRSYEKIKRRIIGESHFNSYQQNPEYIKSMLILEAVRMMLKEIAPKRQRRRKMSESMDNVADQGTKAHASPLPKTNVNEARMKFDAKTGMMKMDHEDADQRHGLYINGKLMRATNTKDEAENLKARDPRFKTAEIKKIAEAADPMPLDVQLIEKISGPEISNDIPDAAGPAFKQAHHYEYQASMARSELYRNSKYAMSMLKQVQPDSEIQPWIASSLTKSAAMLDKVYHYLDYYKKFEPEQLPEDDDGDVELGETSGSVARQNLMMIMEYSVKLFEMIKPGDKLEGWVAMKLTTASECISSCKHYMDYVQFERHAMDDHFTEAKRAKRRTVAETATQAKAAASMIGPRGSTRRPEKKLHVSLNEAEDLAKASTILAAKDIAGQVQEMAEDLAKLSVEELMPLVDIMRGQFGPEAADGFNSAVKVALDELLDLTTKTKEIVSTAVDTLNSGGIPEAETDIETAGEEPESAEPSSVDSDIEKDLASLGGEEEPAAGTEAEPLGRGKKEEVAESSKKSSVSKTHGSKDMKAGTPQASRSKPPVAEASKGFRPDHPDIDGDGDRGEPIKQAAKDKKKKSKEGPVKEHFFYATDKGSDKAAPGHDELARRQQVLGKEPLAKGNPHAGEYKDKGKHGDAYKITGPKGKLPEAEIAEKAPPGKKAEDFIKGNKEPFKKRYGKKWQEVLYATAWKKFGKKTEAYDAHSKSLEEAHAELARLDRDMTSHRARFKAQLAEGRVSDPLNMGYGLEGDAILESMSKVNKRVTSIKHEMKKIMTEGVIGMLKGIQTLNSVENLEKIRENTPYGVIYTTQDGKKSRKMFESADARAYWLELKGNAIGSARLINPETFDAAINRKKGS